MWVGPAAAKLPGGSGGMLPRENVCVRILRDAFSLILGHYFLSFEHREMVKNTCSSPNKKKFTLAA